VRFALEFAFHAVDLRRESLRRLLLTYGAKTCVDQDATMLVVDDEMTSGICRDAGRLRARHTLASILFDQALSLRQAHARTARPGGDLSQTLGI
jgi:hypothetical protein